MARRMLSVFLLFFELICIDIIAGRPSLYSEQTFDFPIDLGTAFDLQDVLQGRMARSINSSSVSNFSDVLFRKLIENSKFRSIFSRQINVDQAMNLGISIYEALTSQTGIRDPYFATNQLLNAMSSVYPGAGHQVFARAIANATAKIMLSNGILNAGNCLFLANTVTPIIINAVTPFYGNAKFGANVDNFFNNFDDIDIDSQDLIDYMDFDTNPDAGVNARLGSGLAFDADLGLGANAGAALNVGAGVGSSIGTRAGVGAIVGIGANLGTQTSVGLGIDAGLSASAGLGIGSGLNVGVGLNSGISASLGADSAVGIGLNSGTNIDNSLNIGVTPDLINFFKVALTKELFKDKYFRYIFSEYVPMPVLNAVTAAMAQYLTKAFAVPRSVFLPLEKAILTLSANETPTLETYADIIATTISMILSRLQITTLSTIQLQVTMAANAISSGISNFLGISAVPGLGLSITSNSYNSFFSALGGLEKLPYVGPDAASRKLPPILKTAKASSFAIRFVKKLYNNLISSSRFYELFSLGVPASTYKFISNSLGNFMAEAFGSPSSSLLADVYTNALLKTIGKLNYKAYAKTLSMATTRALYLLGYFLSGNVNIQAAIATNAILRALNTQSLQKPVTQRDLFPGVYNLPWLTQLAGVAPSDSLLKVQGGIGVDVGADVGARVGLGAGIGLDAGVRLGADVDLKAGVGLDAGIGLDGKFGAKAGLGIDVAGDLDITSDNQDLVDVDLGLSGRAKTNNGKKRILRSKRDLISNTNINGDLQGFIGFDADLGVDANAAVNAAADVGADVSANGGAQIDTNLGIDASANLGVNAGLGLATKLGAAVGLNSNLDVTAGVNSNSGLGVNTNLGIGIGVNGNGNKPGSKLSVLNLLPKVLANKFYKSIALYTSVSIVGSRKVINLIAQGMAAEFGFPIASIFLKSYGKSININSDNTFVSSIIALANATTDALAETGILNSTFSVFKVNQLATAVAAKYSSLMATSLETREWSVKQKWASLYDPDQFDPSVVPCVV